MTKQHLSTASCASHTPVPAADEQAQVHPLLAHRFVTVLPGVRVQRRAAVVGLILIVACLGIGTSALLIGDYPMSAAEAVAHLFGVGSDPLGQFFVQQQRLPRVAAALCVGACLGVSGCIFQQLSANSLGSPDIIGFTTGSASGAVTTIILLGGSPWQIAIGAVVGGVITAVVVYALALNNRKISAVRLVLVGIGVASILQALNALLIVGAELSNAQTAAQWLAGSFNATTWSEAGVAVAVVVCVIPCALLLSRPLAVMTSGDDVAVGLGVRVERRRAELIGVGVLLTALSVAIAGPIAFVALAAPQLARRVAKVSGVGMGSAALMGAALVVASDVIAQRALAPVQLPVGVVTGLLGGIYLVWLLRKQRKES
ncbi:iron chelate uptake ABC transporter family permease subunit [Corynebacterium felinum]|uniref:Iron complex transport system permease protein n=1 Tax=Corynebacterium felinum TaxID=131318 RepID=A0ABU2B5E4_9CORY|nr:iron chelate uptake ABC transporter family permease subunit [Corynebacterium felinum]MDF5820792.1 iron chelate uptake ABC transporter family permease subunit [Corynebacterium felinum]MDR7353835.1 iron complex transport system permease protein [Corynebacterium felinum]WJY96011.1 Ferric enterobactin transport system permease protein FepG [Corynebacterium felinum]